MATLSYSQAATAVRQVRIEIRDAAQDEVLDIATSTYRSEFPSELRMSQQDFKLFLVALNQDEEPNDKLKALFQR
jgi:hypothetical protein